MGYQEHKDLSADSAFVLGADGFPSQIEGYYLGARDVDSQYGMAKLHFFGTEEGNVGVWGKTMLDKMLPTHLGQKCLVTFEGMSKPVKKGRRPAYLYKVLYDATDTIETKGISLSEPTIDDENCVDPNEGPAYQSAPKPISKVQQALQARQKKAPAL